MEGRGGAHRGDEAALRHVGRVREVGVRVGLLVGPRLRGRAASGPRGRLGLEALGGLDLALGVVGGGDPLPVDAQEEHARVPQAVGVEGEEGVQAHGLAVEGALLRLLGLRLLRRGRGRADLLAQRRGQVREVGPEAPAELPGHVRGDAREGPAGAVQHGREGLRAGHRVPGGQEAAQALGLLREARRAEAEDVAEGLHGREEEGHLRVRGVALADVDLHRLEALAGEGGHVLGRPEGVLCGEELGPGDEGGQVGEGDDSLWHPVGGRIGSLQQDAQECLCPCGPETGKIEPEELDTSHLVCEKHGSLKDAQQRLRPLIFRLADTPSEPALQKLKHEHHVCVQYLCHVIK
mmetsp:Transcript_107923/g.315563  ORF Transcript_107923/g.315563 Transcript_107923/m.315563 type:complete len:350 (+) Transcript_107923:287-1336(+)